MPYSKFTLSRAVDDFNLTIVEGERFLPEITPITPTPLLQEILKETIPWAIAVSSEKARSEGIINPVLLEVRRQLKGQISVFSGEEFNVEPEAELSGYCDFLISRSPEQLFIKAPVVIIVEAKKEDLKPALGQCLAEMVAAQRFNKQKQQPIPVIYGTVSSGTVWRFLKLKDQTVTIDLTHGLPAPASRSNSRDAGVDGAGGVTFVWLYPSKPDFKVKTDYNDLLRIT